MPLNSVQTYVKTTLNGLAVPGRTDLLIAYVTPPPVEPLNGTRAYIWGSRMSEKRGTFPRGPGFKTLSWRVDIWLSMLEAASDANLDQAFPLLVDAVMTKLRTVEMPVYITDPTTGQLSQLWSIGEDYEFEYPPELATATNRLMYYRCGITATVEEVIQA